MELADVRKLSNCQFENHRRPTFMKDVRVPIEGLSSHFCSNTSEVAAAGVEGTEAVQLMARTERNGSCSGVWNIF